MSAGRKRFMRLLSDSSDANDSFAKLRHRKGAEQDDVIARFRRLKSKKEFRRRRRRQQDLLLSIAVGCAAGAGIVAYLLNRRNGGPATRASEDG